MLNTGSKSWKLTLATVATTLSLAVAGSLGYDIDPEFVELLIFTALGVGGIGAANAAHKRSKSNVASMPQESNRIADTETKLRELEKQHEYHYTDTHKPLNAKITDLENKVNYLEEAAVDFAKVDGKLEDQIADLGTQNQATVKNVTRLNQKLETLDKHLADFKLHMGDLGKAILDNTKELNQHYKDYLTQKEIEDLIQHHEKNE